MAEKPKPNQPEERKDPEKLTVKKKKAGRNQKGLQQVSFRIRFRTVYGQQLFILGGHPLLGNHQPGAELPMEYLNDAYWILNLDLQPADLIDQTFSYHYILRNADGIQLDDWGGDKQLNFASISAKSLQVTDTWNHAGYFENSFYTEPFREVLLKSNHTAVSLVSPKNITHTLSVKSPLLPKGQTICVLGSADALGNWSTDHPVLMSRDADRDDYTVSLNLTDSLFPIAYKYGVYDTDEKKFIRYEDGNNRILYDSGDARHAHLLHDGFAILPNQGWRGTGIAIPVFSLRTEKSFGVGEFTDILQLTDWAASVGIRMIQLLPVNDTTATHTWTDSYPYAAISAFALHPMYLNLEKMAGNLCRKELKALKEERKRLNALPSLDYERVNALKWQFVRTCFQAGGQQVLTTAAFQHFFEQNRHWLQPYAAFCYLRDQYGTVDFHQWPAFRQYAESEIAALTANTSEAYAEISLHYYLQFHLDQQFREAAAYAHSKGVIIKGDIAIGVYRNGVDAWQQPELYHLDCQAGAPPDDFAVTGQNWGFPTYNWRRMREDGYAWWKKRFAQMSHYADAFRIDHILGFFRIWSIPMHAVEGIMGYFVPAIPVQIQEFHSRNIWFDYARYTQPYITENVLWEIFGYDNELVKSLFLQPAGPGFYTLKPDYRTQKQVEAHFATLERDELHRKIQQGLYDLISNVILFEEPGSQGQQFHFRFNMALTSSYRSLDHGLQQQLQALYVDYFFRRQDEYWKKEALEKLPALKKVTNMLVCGEDLGLVPGCVPDVMAQLGLLSLEIQRMPKDPSRQFFHPNDAPYLSVVTPSTHDMSTIRGWWEENREKTQLFYNRELGQWGEAPYYCEAWINKAIIQQHLYSPAMWCVFQLQDLLGIDAALRRENPADERINIPANPRHYWQYRMHLTLEQLQAADAFNAEVKNMIREAGREGIIKK
ncbi:MAG TPA: 4-alpha-glucanotransferase [Sediminibacterium sp.]|nr:4-alpha-glucanotransferase [Sediminibacterium sp.]